MTLLIKDLIRITVQDL